MHRWGKALGVAVAVAALIFAFEPQARANVIYTYTGNTFTKAYGAYNTTSDRVTGYFVLGAPLAANFSLQSITPLAFSFSDGVQTITNTNITTTPSFTVSTSPSGSLLNWEIAMGDTTTPSIDTCNSTLYCTPAVFDAGWIDNATSAGAIVGSPGSWQVVPEPGSLPLFTPALLGLAFFYRRKRFFASRS